MLKCIEPGRRARAGGQRQIEVETGARPLARVVQEKIKKPLAEELLFGKLVDGGSVSVDFVAGKLAFDIRAEKPSTKSSKDDLVEETV